MREIKFRGKAVMFPDKINELNINHVNGWVYGNLVMCDGIPYIVVNLIEVDIYDYWVKVQPESVGQYTGLKDKNGTPIYEGDLLKHPVGVVAEIKYDNDIASFIAVYTENDDIEMNHLDKKIISKCEVISNIFEHPHLLEVEGK